MDWTKNSQHLFSVRSVIKLESFEGRRSSVKAFVAVNDVFMSVVLAAGPATDYLTNLIALLFSFFF